jgi:GNAT superfamily N-acetyltransferase
VQLAFAPLSPERWPDLERLFGPRGACGGCWCMFWRVKRSEFDRGKGARNRAALLRIVESGAEPGILAYHDGQPVGWCAIEPRASYPTLSRSRILKPVDAQPVWSITCLFVARRFRNQGVSTALLRAAVAFAGGHGAALVEGYPHDLAGGRLPDPFVYTGLVPAFLEAGFKEVARRSPRRPIMRRAAI